MATSIAQRAEGVAATLPLHPLLFAAYPVLRLYEDNMTEIEPAEMVVPLLVFVGVTALGMGLLTLLLRDVRRAAIVASAVVVPTTMFGLLFDVVGPVLGEQRLVLVGICVAFVVAAVGSALRVGAGRLGSVTLGANVIALVLVVAAAIPAARGVAATMADGGDDVSRVANAGASDAITPDRDIYHFILDRYGSEQALETGFGLDNSEFVGWLRDNGFQVVDDAWANYAKTNLSISATLSMSPLDDLADRMGPDGENLAPVVRRISDSAAGAFLQQHGYEYVHVASWYNKTRDSRIADRAYNPEEGVSAASTLYDQSILPALVAKPEPTNDFPRQHADAARYEFHVLDKIRDEPKRKYVFAHILMPHPPYVFLEDGTYAPDEATFATQLADTNRRMKAFLEPLLARPEAERPIIIIQADEGPFPPRLAAHENGFDWGTASDAELVTKFGILDAWYMPGPEGSAPLPDHMTAINTYPELFRRYFGADVPDLPDRIYGSAKDRPYDMIDITDRVAAAAEHEPEGSPLADGSKREGPVAADE